MSANVTTVTDTRGTLVEADQQLPTIRMTRDFNASRERVFAAWVDPELVARWLGPRSLQTRIDQWQPTTGGHYRYASVADGAEVASFYGSFHEVRSPQRLVQTFTYEGVPDSVSLEQVTFEDLGDGRTRMTSVTVVDSLQARDAMVASGMADGVVDSFDKLDELLLGQRSGAVDQPGEHDGAPGLVDLPD